MAASSVMTHRKDVTVLMTDETTVEWEEKVRESGNSRFPVCGEDIDDIVGVVYARELYEFLYDKAENVEEIIHQAYIVPETIAIDVLFENMQKEKTHFAIVADEYGGFAGIVTMDDILSEIVGEIEDEEYDEEEDEDEEDIVKISDSEWEMDGLTPLDEVSEAVGISLPEDEFDTLSGLILDCIDYVPDDGATIDVETNGLKIKATEIKDRRVVRAIVKKL
jgi:putative hemolysin